MATTANATHLIFNDSTTQTTTPVATVPSGSIMTFKQSTAPTGWTKSTAHNNKQFRVVDGSAPVSSGGTIAFTTVYTSITTANTTITTTTMPSHQHGGTFRANQGSTTLTQTGNSWGRNQNLTSGVNSPAGGSTPHNHSIDFAVKYVDLIIATKN